MSRSIFIYALLEPAGDISDPAAVRYIGASNNPRTRLLSHLRESKVGGDNPKAAWLRDLLATGRQPKLLVVEECTADTWAMREVYWIRHFKDADAPLTNWHIGGGCTLSLYPGKKRAWRRRKTLTAPLTPTAPKPAPKPAIDDQDAAVMHTLYTRARWPLRRIVDLYETTELEAKVAIFHQAIVRRTSNP